MRRPRLVWAALLGTSLTVELAAVLADRPDWTLSPQLRWALRSHTTAGRATTTVVIGAGSAWLAHHLITIPTD